MSGKQREKIYKSRNPWRLILKICLSILALLIILAVLIFFGLQKYIVYTPDGVVLDVPFFSR